MRKMAIVALVVSLIALAIPAARVSAQENPCTPTYNENTGVWTFPGCSASELREYMAELEAVRGEIVIGETNGEKTTAGESNGWEVVWTGTAYADRGDGTSFFDDAGDWELPPANPNLWPEFPNVDNDAADFVAAHGLEYGEDESEYCGAAGDACDVTVPPRHYRLITGDWSIEGIGECVTNKEQPLGCALAVFNVGEVTANFQDSMFNNVFTVSGRYWHGDYVNEAGVAVLSHAASNMLNLPSTLNPSGTNAGGNCSVVDGCDGVILTLIITSGNELLMSAETTVSNE